MNLYELEQYLRRPDAPRYEFTPELKKRIHDRQRGRCWICGRRSAHVAHVLHRGLGGDERRNNPCNLIALCVGCHDRLDRRRKPYIRITAYAPEGGPDSGLRVEVQGDDGSWWEMPKSQLWFYVGQARRDAT